MDDYLECLYRYTEETLLPQRGLTREETLRKEVEQEVLEELFSTFSKSQRKLYLRYEAAEHARLSTQARQLFRETFLLAREIFR